jgi:hypothetical protein
VYALGKQHERVVDAFTTHGAGGVPRVEAHFYLIALRNLLRAARLAGHLDRSAADRAVATFTRSVPDASRIRDRLEHFDAYERGKGSDDDMAGRGWAVSCVGADVQVFLLSGQSIHLSEATPAARSLAESLLAVLPEEP